MQELERVPHNTPVGKVLLYLCAVSSRESYALYFCLGFFSASHPQDHNIPDIEEGCHFLCLTSASVMLS